MRQNCPVPRKNCNLTHAALQLQDRNHGLAYRCIHGQPPQYLLDCCIPVTDLATRRHLRSARRHLLAPFNVIGSTLTAVGRCPSDLEFTAGWSAGSGTEFWLLQATTTLFSDHKWCIQCIGGVLFIVDALYKFNLTFVHLPITVSWWIWWSPWPFLSMHVYLPESLG